MTKASPWTAIYQSLPEGRFRITSPDLMAVGLEYGDRILDTDLWGKPARILLLDRPLKLGERIQSSRFDGHYLRSVRLHELPGWPPKMASSANGRALPALMDCALRDATFSSGNGHGQEALELRLDHEGKIYRAWQVGCPLELLKCAEATLNQAGVFGRKLADIQDIRLISGE